jgi:hypothetical protein
LDLNQIDPAYTLQKRKNEYKVYDNWDIVEKRIRNIFQDAVQNSALDEKVKNRYFTSATEFEYEEFFERAENADKSIFLVSRMIVNGQDNKIFAPDNTRQNNFREWLSNTIAQQNRIEASNRFSKAVFFGNNQESWKLISWLVEEI